MFICTRAVQTHGCCLLWLTELVITEFAFRFTLWIHSSDHLKWQESSLHRNTHSNYGKKWNMLTKKAFSSAKRGLQYPPSSPCLLHWTLNGNRNKYQKEMNEILFKGSFPLHFSKILLYLHFKLIIFQLWCCNNSLATDPDVKSWDFCNCYLLCFSLALTHKMKFAFCTERTAQSLRKSNLFSKKSSVIWDNTNTELSIGREWSTFTLTCLKSRIMKVYLVNYSTAIKTKAQNWWNNVLQEDQKQPN